MYLYVVRYTSTDILEEAVASIFRTEQFECAASISPVEANYTTVQPSKPQF